MTVIPAPVTAQARQIEAILFDKDGTLFDFGATWEVWAQALLLRLCTQDADRAAAAGWGIGFDMKACRFLPDSIAIAGTAGQVAEALAPHVPDLSVAQVLAMLNDEAERTPQVEAVPLGPFLDRLRGLGLKLGVATNDAENPARAHLGAAGVIDRFDFIAGFDSGHGAKPGPGQLLAFAKAVGVAPHLVAMVGDSSHDLIAGRSAGMVTVGVLTGIADAGDLAAFADVILPDISHLHAWLGR
ncbi:HAD family hydrolase [Sedimentitalea nanhaiensis]|uniref:phosphoglycolate phosphatase n=1 Tax=Sedimentitalea nanhaiensis TaxID=999627 RepID=A0A1I6ZW21_9RHOB|nr:HAD family hydrolase [Sedimentitalea nanhaiensis]SFT66898.1 phosphoglycolate phosphatase [Sedimentitalea nanhaiensis]